MYMYVLCIHVCIVVKNHPALFFFLFSFAFFILSDSFCGKWVKFVLPRLEKGRQLRRCWRATYLLWCAYGIREKYAQWWQVAGKTYGETWRRWWIDRGLKSVVEKISRQIMQTFSDNIFGIIRWNLKREHSRFACRCLGANFSIVPTIESYFSNRRDSARPRSRIHRRNVSWNSCNGNELLD